MPFNPLEQPVLGAIDVGTNAVRLRIARLHPDGNVETLEQMRDPVRPGEGVFETGYMAKPVVERLVGALRRYASLCARFDATVRAVATSGLREARNAASVQRYVKRQTGLELEVISGKEEARLICLGLLEGKSRDEESLILDIGGGSTEVAAARGEHPEGLWSLPLGTVRLTELFTTGDKVGNQQLRLMREYAEQVAEQTLGKALREAPRIALGSSGTIKALTAFTGHGIDTPVTADIISQTVEELAEMTAKERARHFDVDRADIIVAGAVVLEALMNFIGLKKVVAVDKGLRDGLLLDMVRRRTESPREYSAPEAALGLGRRFALDETHAQQVARLALALFDSLKSLHQLSRPARTWLEVAALLHDVGYAVSMHRHHYHSLYIIQNADIPGLTEHERDLVARIARYHRKTPPLESHTGLDGLGKEDVETVRRLAALLRIADSLDRSRHQPVRDIAVRRVAGRVEVALRSSHKLDLEIWDAQREGDYFESVFGTPIQITQTK